MYSLCALGSEQATSQQVNMPPKKKTKKTTKKNPEKSNFTHGMFFFKAFWWLIICFYKCFCLVAGENDLEAKYKRSILDVAILQDHIGEQQF